MEAILPRLPPGADPREKKERLLEAFSRHLRAQVMEFIRYFNQMCISGER
jgi:hypothetical protein